MPAADPIPELVRRLQSDPDPLFSPTAKDVALARAPGRLDVMGGLTDTAGGLVCSMPLRAAAAVAVQRREDRRLVIKTYNAGASPSSQTRVELSLDDFYGSASLLPDATVQSLFSGSGEAGGGSRQWAAYLAGAFPTLARHKKITRRSPGATIACYSTVPFGVGLGSSAAVACAALAAIAAAFPLILDPLEIALLAQRLEHHVVGEARGLLDPATAVLGKEDQLLLLACQPHAVRGYLPVPAGVLFAAVNTGVLPASNNPTYREARASALIAQALVGQTFRDFGIKKDPTGGYLAQLSRPLFDRYFTHLLPETLAGSAFLRDATAGTADRASVHPAATYRPRAAAEFHMAEHHRTLAFVEQLRLAAAAADAATRRRHAAGAGRLMLASHADTGRLLGLGHEATDLLVSLLQAHLAGDRKGEGGDAGGEIFGARVMGAAAGGSVAVMAADTPAARRQLEAVCAAYRERTGRDAQLLVGSSPGTADVSPVRMPPAELVTGASTSAQSAR